MKYDRKWRIKRKYVREVSKEEDQEGYTDKIHKKAFRGRTIRVPRLALHLSRWAEPVVRGGALKEEVSRFKPVHWRSRCAQYRLSNRSPEQPSGKSWCPERAPEVFVREAVDNGIRCSIDDYQVVGDEPQCVVSIHNLQGEWISPWNDYALSVPRTRILCPDVLSTFSWDVTHKHEMSYFVHSKEMLRLTWLMVWVPSWRSALRKIRAVKGTRQSTKTTTTTNSVRATFVL